MIVVIVFAFILSGIVFQNLVAHEMDQTLLLAAFDASTFLL